LLAKKSEQRWQSNRRRSRLKLTGTLNEFNTPAEGEPELWLRSFTKIIPVGKRRKLVFNTGSSLHLLPEDRLKQRPYLREPKPQFYMAALKPANRKGMIMAKPKSGGGMTMRHNREVGVKYGPAKTNRVDKTSVSHIGNMIGSHYQGGDVVRRKYPLYEGQSPQVKSGNAAAAELAGKGGPGKGRTIYKTGSQGTHGAVNPGSSPARRDTLAEYGSDMPSASMLKR